MLKYYYSFIKRQIDEKNKNNFNDIALGGYTFVLFKRGAA